MQHLQQFDYIFAIGIIFAFLDAFNIGANDVANSFSSSVSSRSLKYWQAMILAAICEFLGAVLAGSRVSDTIRTKIIDLNAFEDSTGALMLAMMCALVGSSLWCSFATYICLPVSSTHSITGALIGAGIATVGSDNIIWGWKGFSQVVASWFIAPVLGGCISSIIFLITKYLVLESKNPLKRAFMLVPIIVFATFSILTMLIVWKGAPNLHLNNLSTGATAGSIFGVGGVAMILYLLLLHPILYRRLVHNDWTIPFWHLPFGFIYFFKSIDSIPPLPEGRSLVTDYYAGKGTDAAETLTDEETGSLVDSEEEKNAYVGEINIEREATKVDTKIEKPELTIDTISWNALVTKNEYKIWKQMLRRPQKWPLLAYLVASHGFRHDVIQAQMNPGDCGPASFSNDVAEIHKRSKVYDVKVEHMFSILQAVTACTMSFAHGSNDISNASAPLSTIYMVWTTNSTSSKMTIPVWVLCFTAASLVIGIWIFGYRIMGILGNKLILQSPSRGFAIELGAAVTVVMATRLSIPVSTTQIAIGCTVFVGLCNWDIKGCNWRIVMWSYLGWILTLPIAGLISGILTGIIVNAPRMGVEYSFTS